MGRIAVFIDGGYLDHVLRDEFHGIKIDYEKFPKLLANNDNLLRTYYYHCEPWQDNPPTEEQSEFFSNAQRFHSALRKIPNFEVRLGRLASRGRNQDGKMIVVQKGVDIYLTVDFLRLSFQRSITKAFIVTNDSDFVPAIRYVKDQGVQVILVHGRNPQRHLLESVDSTVRMDRDFIQAIEY
jgi:uncharacterized LabA/DUF88 family protein